MRRAHRLLWLALLATACASGRSGLRLTLLDASVQRPSNLAVYFTVDTQDGQPVPGLTAESFRIYEDNDPVSVLESQQTILNPEVAAAHHTLLLIDMSGSVTGSGDVPAIVESARGFSERVQKYQKVAIYAFDGSPEIHPITSFGSGAQLAGGAERLSSFKPRDPSTNLNGAIVEAMKMLRRQMTTSSAPLTFGTLVVFTDGTDRAHRVPREQLHKELDANPDLDILVIGVGAEIDGGELRQIGRDGAILTKDRSQINASFDDAAARVEAFSKRYYLFGYCSPARAGEHDVRIQALAQGKSGDLTYHFNAQGFGAPCDATQKPAFSLKRTRPAAARPGEVEIVPPAPGGSHF